MLEMDGYQIREARDGRECVMMAQEEPPDLALIDLSMPELDGWSVLRELRSDSRTRSIICVALTAFASDKDRRRTLAAGFDAHVSKPFHSKDLLETIKQLLTRGQTDHGG